MDITKVTEMMDMLEKVAIVAMKPIVRQVMEKESEEEVTEATRRLLGKIGSRIMFGAETFDAVLAHKKEKKSI